MPSHCSVHEELNAWKRVSERLSSNAIWQEELDASPEQDEIVEWRMLCERLASISLWTTRLPRRGMSSTFAESDDSTSAGDSGDSDDGFWGGMSSDEG